MVVRTWIRAFVFPLALYSIAGAVSGYFIWTTNNGERGLKAKAEYKQQIYALRANIEDLKTERRKWEHRVLLMRSENVDRDLAEEEARVKLDFVDPRDVVLFVEPPHS